MDRWVASVVLAAGLVVLGVRLPQYAIASPVVSVCEECEEVKVFNLKKAFKCSKTEGFWRLKTSFSR